MAGAMSLGTLVAATSYLAQLAQPLRRLSWLTGMLALCQAGAERLFEILDAIPEVQDAPRARPLPHLDGWVRFEHVSFHYSANVPVLHDITFSAAPGQVIALLGSTGSGKSTIAQLIPRFYDVTSGCITIDGVDIRTYQLAVLRRHIGIVMQDTLLFSTTIRDNIAYGREDLDLDTVIAAAKAARAHDFIMQCPDGYDTWVGERGGRIAACYWRPRWRPRRPDDVHARSARPDDVPACAGSPDHADGKREPAPVEPP